MNLIEILLQDLKIRPYRRDDIPHFYAISMREDFRAYISNFSATHTLSDFIRNEQQTLDEQVWKTRRYVLEKDGITVAYPWIVIHDLHARMYELSLVSHPDHQFGLGYLSMLKMFDFLFYELNAARVLGRIAQDNHRIFAPRVREGFSGYSLRPQHSHMGDRVKSILEWTFSREAYETFKDERKQEWLERSQRFRSKRP